MNRIDSDLMVYVTIDALPLLSLAGHTTKAVEYLLGNHTIAETMFRHDPRAPLYAPRSSRWTSLAPGAAAWASRR